MKKKLPHPSSYVTQFTSANIVLISINICVQIFIFVSKYSVLSKEIFSLNHSDYNVCVYKMCCHLVFISCKSKDRSRGYRITFYDFENLFRKYHVTIQNRLNGLSCKPNPKYKQKWCGARELCSCDRKLTLKFSQGLLRSLII